MSGVVQHLVKRGVQVAHQHHQQSQDDVINHPLSTWGVAALYATALIYLAVMFAVEYTYGLVVATLTMIETPTATAVIKVTDADSEDPDSPLLSLDEKVSQTHFVEPELLLVKTQPITAKIRTTVKHLKARAGFLSRFRGLHVALLYSFAHGCLFQFLDGFNFIPQVLAAVIATVVLCRIQLTWTHIVVSEPSTKRWFRRVPDRKSFLKIAGPTAVYALAQQGSIVMLALVIEVFGLKTHNSIVVYFRDSREGERIALTIQVLLVGFLGLAAAVLIIIPARVALTRVQASMLPEEDESIVPFDRTFGGKVVPEILGGSGRIAMLEAWKSFDWNGRVRLLKLYVKIFAIQTAVTILFTMVAIGELKLILGDGLNKMVADAHAQAYGSN
ncbi:hypothetical protein MMC24_006158 [Lignoscripta atroalba]|nr:hypothetical protein [Lignoscripta atroalba]